MSARIISTPLARKLARRAGVDIALVRGSGPGGRVVAADLARQGAAQHLDTPAIARPDVGEGRGAGGIAAAARRVASTPYARRLARARPVDLARIKGTGPNGRILARDVVACPAVTIEVATAAVAALCAHLGRALARGAPPIAMTDVVTKAAARAWRGAVAWTVDGIRPAWGMADAGSFGLAAIARARMAGQPVDLTAALLLRAAARSDRVMLTITFPPGENHRAQAAVAAQIRDTIAWPIGLLL